MKCKSRAKRLKGRPCPNDAVRGRDYCKAHLKNRPIGPAHPNFQHGRRSKYLPARLAERYAQALEDPELSEYRHNIALLSVRADELLESGESFLLWEMAQATFSDLEKALKDGDTVMMNAALMALRDLVSRGRADSLRWREWYETNEREGRMKEREHRRLAQMENYISAEHYLAVMGLIVNAASQTITDKDSLRRFTAAVDALWSGGVDARTTPGH